MIIFKLRLILFRASVECVTVLLQTFHFTKSIYTRLEIKGDEISRVFLSACHPSLSVVAVSMAGARPPPAAPPGEGRRDQGEIITGVWGKTTPLGRPGWRRGDAGSARRNTSPCGPPAPAVRRSPRAIPRGVKTSGKFWGLVMYFEWSRI